MLTLLQCAWWRCAQCRVWRAVFGAQHWALATHQNVNWHVAQVSDFGLSRTVEQEAVNTVSCGCSELRTGPLVAPWLGSELAARVFWQQGAHSFPLGCPLLVPCSLHRPAAPALLPPSLVHACMHHLNASPQLYNHPTAPPGPAVTHMPLELISQQLLTRAVDAYSFGVICVEVRLFLTGCLLDKTFIDTCHLLDLSACGFWSS